VTATELYGAGYTDLVCVVPPDGQLAENTTIVDRGKAPGLRGPDGWHGYNWRAHRTTHADATRWDEWGANVGVRGDKHPSVDIDVDDERLARVVQQIAHRVLGPAPVRRSTGSRRLLPYRTAEPFPRLALVITWQGQSHKIEILAAGRQYLVAGTHPSGQPYRWEQPLPAPDQLTLVDRDKVERFLSELERELRRVPGIQLERVGGGAEVAPPAQEGLQAPSLEALAELVARIPNREADRDGYVRFGHAVKAAGGEEAAYVFAEWAARWEDGYNDPETVERDYAGFRGPFRLGWDWLVRYADEACPVDPQDEFEADLSAAPPAPEELAVSSVPAVISEDAVSLHLLPAMWQRLRYIPAGASGSNGQWLVWAGHRWVRDRDLEHRKIVAAGLRQLVAVWRERAAAAPKGEGKEFAKAAAHYSSDPGHKRIVSMLQPLVATKEENFDVSIWDLNTPTGIVNLRTGAVRPSRPQDMFTRSTTVAPRAGDMPLFRLFLDQATGGDVELQGWLQRMFGYCLTGDVSAKHFWFMWGTADTGKSTFIRIMSALFGDYADSVDIEAFIGSNPSRIPADLARLPGVRLVTATEPPANRAWDEKRIKAITGGDRITARFLYQNDFTYDPQFKIIVVGNHEPEIRNVDDAMLRRIQIVPLNVPVPRDRQIEGLSERIVAEEGPQILQWLIDGCLQWQESGLQPPACVLAKTTEYGEDEDIVAQFLSEECEADSNAEITRNELYRHWSIWCRMRGYEAGVDKGLKRQLAPFEKKMGFRNALVTSRRLSGYRGLRLRDMMEVV
jgi:P4 family phage/plasmid primase-like protien